jgi:hypothetical protein
MGESITEIMLLPACRFFAVSLNGIDVTILETSLDVG